MNLSSLKSKPSSFFVTCPSGLEPALCEELEELFSQHQLDAHVMPGSAGCVVRGPFACGIVANLASFCASRVLFSLWEGQVYSEAELTRVVSDLPWDELFGVDHTFCVKSTATHSFVQNSMYLSLKVKDALCDKFVEKLQKRPNVDTTNPQVTIFVRLVKNQLSLSLDLSGQPLFMRGYKHNSHEASLKETLAASLLRLSGWNRLVASLHTSSEPVYFDRASQEGDKPSQLPKKVLLAPFLQDQFCGSGTIVIEAALALMQNNPNTNRSHFAYFSLFPQHAAWITEQHELCKQAVLQKRVSAQDVKKAMVNYCNHNRIYWNNSSSPLQGSDISAKSIEAAESYAKKAEVTDLVSFVCASVDTTKPQAGCGFILVNPPYGERIGHRQNLPELYKSMGDQWKKEFANWSGWLLSSNESLTKSVGLRATRKFSVYNGNLECRFLQYVMVPRAPRGLTSE
jgi:putative N6-adenine-specific DNA methylase